MKNFRKVLSVVMAAVMFVCMVPVTAVAASTGDLNVKVDGFDNGVYNGVGEYCVRVDGLTESFMNTWMYNAAQSAYFAALVEVHFKKDGRSFTLVGMWDYLGENDLNMATIMESDKTFDIDGRFYSNTSSGGDCGYVFFIPEDSGYIDIITSCTSAEVGVGYFSALTNDYLNWDNREYTCKSVETSFKKNNNSSKDVSSLKITAPKKQTYTGKTKTPDVTIKDGDYKLVKGTDYTLTYKNNKKIGKATVTIKGKGKYSGTKSVSFNIVPKKPTLKASEGNDKVTLKWSDVKGAEKYQIYYSVNGGKYKKLSTTSKTSKTVSNLDFSKNSYKFKVRAIAEGTDGKTYAGSFSKVVTIKK